MERHAVRAVRPVIVLVQGPAKVVEAVEVVKRGRLSNVSLLSVHPEFLGQLCDHGRVLSHGQNVVLSDWEDVLVDELIPSLIECVIGQIAPDPLASVAGTVAVFDVGPSSDEGNVSELVQEWSWDMLDTNAETGLCRPTLLAIECRLF